MILTSILIGVLTCCVFWFIGKMHRKQKIERLYDKKSEEMHKERQALRVKRLGRKRERFRCKSDLRPLEDRKLLFYYGDLHSEYKVKIDDKEFEKSTVKKLIKLQVQLEAKGMTAEEAIEFYSDPERKPKKGGFNLRRIRYTELGEEKQNVKKDQ